MKICSRCNQDLPDESFSLGRPGKLHSYCKQCMAAYERQRYVSGDKVRKDRNKKVRADRQREMLDNIKLESGCVDCGYKASPKALDFDHVRGIKQFNIADNTRMKMSDKRLLDEVSKCEVRCANCHRVKTHG